GSWLPACPFSSPKRRRGRSGPFKTSGRRTLAFQFVLAGLGLLLATILLALRLLLLLLLHLLAALLLLLATRIPVLALIALVHHVSPDARSPC
ncbi:MAG TPA: hypothetical protein VLG14_19240, partial [Sphingomonas sp.]|nr:hypothetical protein [Sphingomonas sp.]